MGGAAHVRNDIHPALPANVATTARARLVSFAPVMAPRIFLYSPRGMPFTEKVGRALRFKQLAFELVEPKSPEDYRRFSPKTGLLPVLELDGEKIPDSSAILDHLDERFPEPPLLSTDARVAREQRQLERWFDETFPYYILRWVQRRVGASAPLKTPGEGFPIGPMVQLGMIGSDGKFSPEWFDTSDGGPGPEFVRRLDDLLHMLGKRRFFYADQLSRADLSVSGSLSVMYRDIYPGARALLEARKPLLEHTERVLAATGGPDPV
jgi:glutathione S-transferase